MKTVYADASVMVSLILEDGNSIRAKELLRDFNGRLVWTDFLKLEVFNAIRMGVGEGRQTELEAGVSLNLAKRLVANGKWQKHELDWARAFARAQGLSNGHTSETKARSLDIVHVACALELGIRDFWSFDNRQKMLAERAGLWVNNA